MTLLCNRLHFGQRIVTHYEHYSENPDLSDWMRRWNFHDGVIEWKHFPRHLPLVRGIHRYLNCAWTNGWLNNRVTGDLRRHRAHYDVTVMLPSWRRGDHCNHFQSHYQSHDVVFGINANIWRLVFWAEIPKITYVCMKWKHFPRNRPFVRGIHRSRWTPHTKASDAELWCLLWSASE